MWLEDKALPQWTQINSMTPLGKGYQAERQFWGTLLSLGASGTVQQDVQEWKLPTFQTQTKYLICSQTGSLGETLGSMSTSRESQGRTAVELVQGVPDEKGVEWAVECRAWALLKHTCMALGSAYGSASHSLVIQDRAEVCSHSRDISSGMESRWMAGKERMCGEAGDGTKSRLTTSKDITCTREASPAECPSSWAFPQAFHSTIVSPHFCRTFVARLGHACRKHCYTPQDRSTSESALVTGCFQHVVAHLTPISQLSAHT